MKEELLLRVQIPHYITRGKSRRKLWTNFLLGMHYQRYASIHKDWKKLVTQDIKAAYQAKPFGHETETKYHITLGFQRGKSTKRCDLSGMSILLKWAEDMLVDLTAIPDDSYQYVVETRCKYLGMAPDGQEKVILQLTKEVQDEL